MNTTIKAERENYRPGEEIRGVVSWTDSHAPKLAELRLFWHTTGKGGTDSFVAEVQTFDLPQAEDTRSFLFRAPDFPYSFSGKLISLIWSLELVLDSKGEKTAEIIISPDGAEIELQNEALLTMADPAKSSFSLPWVKNR